MRSCIVFSSPRAGTHLVMTGLHVMGMKEARALTDAEWGYSINDDGTSLLLDMPEFDHYRFGAHVADPKHVKAYSEQDRIYGVYISRDLRAQARSFRAYLAVYRAQNVSEGDAFDGTVQYHNDNAIWAEQPNVLSVRFEDLIQGKGWQEISDHLGGCKVDVDAIMAHVPPKPGDKYYRNTRSTPIYYEGARS